MKWDLIESPGEAGFLGTTDYQSLIDKMYADASIPAAYFEKMTFPNVAEKLFQAKIERTIESILDRLFVVPIPVSNGYNDMPEVYGEGL